MSAPPVLSLTAVQRLAAVEQSRGIVRLGPQARAALGAQHLDLLRLQGARSTGALVAAAPPGTPPDLLLCDELLLANLGVPDGSVVTASLTPVVAATSVTVSGPPEVVAVVDAALLRSALHGKVLTAGDAVSLLPHDLPEVAAPDRTATRQSLHNRLSFRAQTVRLTVLQVTPPGPVLVGAGTVVRWEGAPASPAQPVAHGVPYAPAAASAAVPVARVEDLPGLEQQAHRLREWLDLGFSHRDLLERLGTRPQLGVLLSGPAGSGKAALVAAVGAELGLPLVVARGPELAAMTPDAAAGRLGELLADRGVPTVVLVEDVEAVAPREGAGPLLPTLLGLLEAAVRSGTLAVVCTTARPEQVHPGLRAPGLLDHELVVPLPDKAQRRALLAALAKGLPLADDVSLDDVAARTPGFVAADVLALLRAAGLRAAGRQRGAQTPQLSAEDLDGALDVVRPTAAEGTLALGGLTLDDVGDMAEVKTVLTETVLWPLRYPDTFTSLGVQPPRGVLLYGPPGCGKTFLVRALAGSGEANVLSVKGAELLTKWVGESERAVRELFRRAREAAPSLIFLDEVDALAPVRGGGTDGGTSDRVVAALLTELDGIEQRSDVVVVGATNRPDRIDPALLRPGRLERLVFVPPPDAAARVAILKASSKRVPLAQDVDLDALGEQTDGYSAADCAALIREAALTAMRESLQASTVTAAHLAAALEVVRPSLDPAQVAALEAYARTRGQG